MNTLRIHLMDDLLSLCGARGPVNGYLQVTPVLTDVTCPDCRLMTPGWLAQAHAEALQENAAHDAAMQTAQELTPTYLTRYADERPPMPRRLRNQLQARSVLSLVVPRPRT